MNKAPVLRSAAALRRWRKAGKGSLGLVPTMGALHAGHLSLVRKARQTNARVLVSIFVNPTQFGPLEDFSRYPRDLLADRQLLAEIPGTTVFAPSVADIYPHGFCTTVEIGGTLGSRLEAQWRPGHFEGVATVVARLFGMVAPQNAYFGLKDYQQFLVIQSMVRDLQVPVTVHGCPTLREADGLALSSRNRYLNDQQRGPALALVQSLRKVKRLAQDGERQVSKLEAAGERLLRAVPGLKIQYFSVADARTLAPLKRLDRPAVALTACQVGHTRLIDNLRLGNH